MDHPASSAFARDPEKAPAVGAGRIDIVIDQRARRITDPESRARKARRHLGFLLVAARSGPQPLVEKTDARKRRCAKRHARAQYATYFDYLVAMIDDWEIEPRRGLHADLGRRILGRQDAPLHRRELGMLSEETLDLVEVMWCRDEVIIKANDDFALGLSDGGILDSTLAGSRIVEMLERRPSAGQNRGQGSAVLGHEYFARRLALHARYLGREAFEQARERVRACVGCDYDREAQSFFAHEEPANTACKRVSSDRRLEFVPPAD